MSFTKLCNEIFNQAIRDYHVTDNIDTPINNPYKRETIENRLYLKCWIDTVLTKTVRTWWSRLTATSDRSTPM